MSKKSCKTCVFYREKKVGKGKTSSIIKICEVKSPEVMGVYLGRDPQSGQHKWDTLGLSSPVIPDGKTICGDWENAGTKS